MKKVPAKSNKKLFNTNISSFFMRSIPYIIIIRTKSSLIQIYQVFLCVAFLILSLSAHKSSIKNGEVMMFLHYFWNYTPHILLKISIWEFHRFLVSSWCSFYGDMLFIFETLSANHLCKPEGVLIAPHKILPEAGLSGYSIRIFFFIDSILLFY